MLNNFCIILCALFIHVNDGAELKITYFHWHQFWNEQLEIVLRHKKECISGSAPWTVHRQANRCMCACCSLLLHRATQPFLAFFYLCLFNTAIKTLVTHNKSSYGFLTIIISRHSNKIGEDMFIEIPIGPQSSAAFKIKSGY